MTIRSVTGLGVVASFVEVIEVLPETEGDWPTLISPGFVLGRYPLWELVIICESNISMSDFWFIQHS